MLNLMAELVSTAIVQGTVSQILSGLVQKYQEKHNNSNEKRNLERIETAHIKLEVALETSDKWQINDASLLRWRRKLKRVAQECDDTLHKCKQRILEVEQIQREVKNSSLSNRIVHATKSFVFSVINPNNNELSTSIARRFEWYADGASEYLRFIELGCTPCHEMPFPSLVRNLFAGKELHHKIVRGSECPLFQFWLAPISNPVHGTDVSMIFIQYDGTPQGNICFNLVVQLSESIDIVGIAVKYLQLFAPHFKCRFENIRNELTQLLTQDFSWGPTFHSYHKEHWDKIHSLFSQFFRPNPFCCKEHGVHEVRHFKNLDMAGLPSGLLEPEQHFLPTDITLEQLEEIMLPKAIDYFCQNDEAMVYKMIWKSVHGFALIHVEKPCMSTRRSIMRRRSTSGGARKRNLLQGDDEELIRIRIRLCHWLDLWFKHVPVRLQRSVMNWMQKEKKILLEAPQLHLKF
ncbi:unnamed protein product [Urochloa decumbens]|uniref:Rx N-terminal domain-containing protein n=1 Tax=Urochloa decumbens TaxID=240449 RepID=A0ABC9DAE7_9POAL